MPLYAESGVKEYWLVTPNPPLVEVFTLEGRRFWVDGACGESESVTSEALSGVATELSKVFTFPIPPEDRNRLVEESVPPCGASVSQQLWPSYVSTPTSTPIVGL
jgi:hypothetical protein